MMWYDYIWGNMPISEKVSRKKLAKMGNLIEAQNFFVELFGLAVNTWEWELPDTCDSRMIERSRLLYGTYMLAEIGGEFITPACVPGAGLTLYGYASKAWGWGCNGFNHEFTAYVRGAESQEVATSAITLPGNKPDCVVGLDNALCYPYINYIMTNAFRLSDTLRAADVAVQNLKSPGLIFCDDSQKKTVNDILNAREENIATVIAVKNSVTAGDFSYYPTNQDANTLSEIWNYFCNIQSLATGKWGINSNPQEDKAERLLVDEVNANNQLTEANLDVRERYMELFCRDVKACFGLDINYHRRRKVKMNVSTDDTEGMADRESDSGPMGDSEPGPADEG